MKQNKVKRPRGRPRRELVFVGSNAHEYMTATIEHDFDNIFRCYHELPSYGEPVETGFVTKRENDIFIFYGAEGRALWDAYWDKYKRIHS